MTSPMSPTTLPTIQPRPSRNRAGLSTLGAIVGGLLVLALIVGVVYMKTYNGLVNRSESVTASMTEIKNQYKRRNDLIPNLIATVQGAADFEGGTITAVTEARARVGSMQLPADLASDPAAMQKFMAAQGELSGALSRLLVVAENYPNLTATAGYRDLQSQLEGAENRIAVARRDAIESIASYNKGVKRFPAVLIAGKHGYATLPALEFKETSEELDTVPTVDFSND